MGLLSNICRPQSLSITNTAIILIRNTLMPHLDYFILVSNAPKGHSVFPLTLLKIFKMAYKASSHLAT